MSQPLPHSPVMLDECLKGLKIHEDSWYIDATFGAGGHSRAILNQGAKVLAFDQDPNVNIYIKSLREELASNQDQSFTCVADNFKHMESHTKRLAISPVLGVLFDLGVSSMQLDEAERGFSFRRDGPLDMRMSQEGLSAKTIINTYEQNELAALIYKYGEERYSRLIAKAIVDARKVDKFNTTQALSKLIEDVYPKKSRRDHPARRTFQALRIAVNDELRSLELALNASLNVLSEKGRLVILSYHSLEDRIVKQFIKNHKSITSLYKKPLRASEEETSRNPRARSAKLRIAEKGTL